MNFTFDLISDLHVLPTENFDWNYQATSPFCIVAGDVARDQTCLLKTLKNLGKNYQAVFYIDGNEEHKNNLKDIGFNYRQLTKTINRIPNVTYLQDNVVVLNNVAIIGTNAWMSFDWDTNFSIDESKSAVESSYNVDRTVTNTMQTLALMDSKYLQATIQKLQAHTDVKHIIIVTHFVPHGKFIEHDLDFANNIRLNSSINSRALACLENDTEKKIRTWCFGHYHNPVDETIDGIRYICNPRGRIGTPWCQAPYWPKRIEC